MRNFWLIAKHAYLTTVAQRRFVVLTLAIPVGMALLIVFGIAVALMSEDNRPLGYVDQAGLLDPARQAAIPNAEDGIQLQPYASVEEGQWAVERDEIQALFVFPPGYPDSRETQVYYESSPPDGEAWSTMADFVRANLVTGLDDNVQRRLLEDPNVVVYDLASGRSFDESDIVTFIMPFVATFFFFFATMSAAGYMLGVVATEKENRTMELMLTSVTPGQLIGGKMVGMLAASLTQFAIYVLAAAVGLWVAGIFVVELAGASVPWDYLGVMALYFFPAYVLLAGMMVTIGAATTEMQQAQQVAGLLNLAFVIPLFVLPLLIENSAHPAAIFLTLFPTTSFLTISLRWAVGTIPLWQMIVAWVILSGTAIASVWAAARVFRAGMLRYGQPLNIKSVLGVLRGAVS
ncbi:MAG: ABC transporter permease [Anaerolineae bacterium]|jgi:ABC-2 type transport system permease protein